MRKLIKCRTGETFSDYGKYLKSRHWRNTRKRYFEKYPYECAKCGWKKCLHLHHKTYERIGREKLDDLVAVCAKCHAAIHANEDIRRKGAGCGTWLLATVLIILFLWSWAK